MRILLLLSGLLFSYMVLAATPNALMTNTFAYIDQPHDAQTHLTVMGGYRGYAAQTGVFTKQDSYSPFVNRKTANGFDYGAGNPVMHVDHSGHIFWEVELASELLDLIPEEWNGLANTEENISETPLKQLGQTNIELEKKAELGVAKKNLITLHAGTRIDDFNTLLDKPYKPSREVVQTTQIAPELYNKYIANGTLRKRLYLLDNQMPGTINTPTHFRITKIRLIPADPEIQSSRENSRIIVGFPREGFNSFRALVCHYNTYSSLIETHDALQGGS